MVGIDPAGFPDQKPRDGRPLAGEAAQAGVGTWRQCIYVTHSGGPLLTETTGQ